MTCFGSLESVLSFRRDLLPSQTDTVHTHTTWQIIFEKSIIGHFKIKTFFQTNRWMLVFFRHNQTTESCYLGAFKIARKVIYSLRYFSGRPQQEALLWRCLPFSQSIAFVVIPACSRKARMCWCLAAGNVLDADTHTPIMRKHTVHSVRATMQLYTEQIWSGKFSKYPGW